MWEIMIALRLLLISSPALSGAQDEDVLYYEDIKSQDLRDQFDRAPLISKSVTKSDWCKVINLYLCIDNVGYRKLLVEQ